MTDGIIAPHTVIAFICVSAAIIYFGWNDIVHSSPWRLILYSLIPIIHVTRWLLRQNHFEANNVGPYVFASLIIDFPFVLVLWLVGRLFFPPATPVASLPQTEVVLFVIGTVIAGIGANYFNHRGMKVSAGKGWITSYMLFLVPPFVAATSPVIAHLLGIDISYQTSYVYLAVIIAFSFVLLYYPQLKSLWKRDSNV